MKRLLVLKVIAKYRYGVENFIKDAYSYANQRISKKKLASIRHQFLYRDDIKDQAVEDYTLDILAGRHTPPGRNY